MGQQSDHDHRRILQRLRLLIVYGWCQEFDKFYGPTDGPFWRHCADTTWHRRLLSEVDDVFVAGLPLQGGVQRSHLLSDFPTQWDDWWSQEGVVSGHVAVKQSWYAESWRVSRGSLYYWADRKKNVQQNGYPTISSKIMEEPRLDDGKDQAFWSESAYSRAFWNAKKCGLTVLQ